MSSTLLIGFLKGRDGEMLRESFETPDWLTDQRWTAERGDPQNSTAITPQEGVKSFILDVDNPLIQRIFTDSAGDPDLLGYSAVYFYDDATNTTTTQQAFIQWSNEASYVNAWGLGVDNAVTTANYVMYINGVASDSGVARTTGWRKFELIYIDLDQQLMNIDGVGVADTTPTGGASDRIRVGSINDDSVAQAFYFDFVQVARAYTITIAGEVGQVVTLFDSAGTSLVVGTISATTTALDVTSQAQPFDGYFTITGTDGATPYYRSDTLSLFAGDRYQLYTVDMERRATALEDQPSVKRVDKEANSGAEEGIVFNARNRMTITLADITDEERQTLLAWWATAQRLEKFAVAIDSNETVDTHLIGNAAAGSTGVSVYSTAGIAVGSELLLRSADRLNQEHMTVASIVGSAVIGETTLQYQYAVGDRLTSHRFWPHVTVNDATMNITLSDRQTKRWTFTLSFKEAL